jgi:hypothetical protein
MSITTNSILRSAVSLGAALSALAMPVSAATKSKGTAVGLLGKARATQSMPEMPQSHTVANGAKLRHRRCNRAQLSSVSGYLYARR